MARSQQAAFLIALWSDVRSEVISGPRHLWIREFPSRDEAFTARASMLNQDMGVRAVLSVTNDIFYANAEEWALDRWFSLSESESEIDNELISVALDDLEGTKFRKYVKELAAGLMVFDWRSFDGPNVKENSDEAVRKRSYRGSGGYASLRNDVLSSIADSDDTVGRAARELLRSEL